MATEDFFSGETLEILFTILDEDPLEEEIEQGTNEVIIHSIKIHNTHVSFRFATLVNFAALSVLKFAKQKEV